jgi:hypothetical protein
MIREKMLSSSLKKIGCKRLMGVVDPCREGVFRSPRVVGVAK